MRPQHYPQAIPVAHFTFHFTLETRLHGSNGSFKTVFVLISSYGTNGYIGTILNTDGNLLATFVCDGGRTSSNYSIAAWLLQLQRELGSINLQNKKVLFYYFINNPALSGSQYRHSECWTAELFP
jgi:hypothetical protein